MKDILEALKFMTAFAAFKTDGCTVEEYALVEIMTDPDDSGNVRRTIERARHLIAKAEPPEPHPNPQIRTSKGYSHLVWGTNRSRAYSCRDAAKNALTELKAGGPYHSAAEIELALIAIGTK